MAPRFSATEDEKLIEEVRKYSAIYDTEQGDYKDLAIKDAIWEKIGVLLEKNAEDCKIRWRNIRDNYFKHKNKKLATGSAASYEPRWPLYKQLTFLDLVKNKRRTFTNVARAETSQSEVDEFMDQEDESQSSQLSITSNPSSPIHQESSFNKKKKVDNNSFSDSTPQTSRSATPFSISRKQKKNEDVQGMEERSRKRLELLEKIANTEDDEVDLFFKSIALKVKKMKPHLITKTQLKVLMVVSEIEAEAQIFTTQAGHNSTQTNPESFTCQANTYSFSPQGNPQLFPTQANTYAFPPQGNLQSFPTQANTYAFPPQGNLQSFPTQANTYSSPSQGNPQSFTTHTSNQSFPTQLNIQSSNTTWTKNTSQNLQNNETNISPTQHAQHSQKSFPENP